jgi:SAM-dependent methyltransferase
MEAAETKTRRPPAHPAPVAGRTDAGPADQPAGPYPAQVPHGPATPDSVWDRAAPTYGRTGPDHFSHFAQQLIQFIPIKTGATVLDLACGTGALASAATLAAPQISKLVAADLSAAMLHGRQPKSPSPAPAAAWRR